MRAVRWIAVAGVAGALVTAPWWLGAYELGILLKILIWGLFAISFDLVFGYTGMLSLGHSVYFGLGAYGAALMVLHVQPGVLLPLTVGLLVGLAAAIVIGALAVRASRHGFIIVTAVSALIVSLVAQSQRALTGGEDGLTVPPPPLEVLGWSAGCVQPGPAFLMILLLVSLSFVFLYGLVRAPVGTALRSVRDNESRARSLGYDILRVKWLAFALSGGGAALSGALLALTNCYVSTGLFHWLVSADVLVWTLFGGMGTLVGPLVGTGVFFALREALSGVWPSGYPILIGMVLLFVVRLFPQGLMGVSKRVERGVRPWARGS